MTAHPSLGEVALAASVPYARAVIPDDNPKALKMAKAAEACLRLIAAQGLGAVSFARVAREAGLTRPWLYKYVGRSKKSLMEHAVDHFGNILVLLEERPNPKSSAEWSEINRQLTGRLLDLASAHPSVFHVYYRYRGSPNAIGERIARIEAFYFERITGELGRALGMTGARARELGQTLMAVRMGLVHQWLSSAKQDKVVRARILSFDYEILCPAVVGSR
jgi:AcrR family transcriptional regulator